MRGRARAHRPRRRARREPRRPVPREPFRDRRPRVRFYASAPLTAPEGVIIGRLRVFDSEPRELDGAQEEALVAIAGRVVDVLELRLRTRELEDSLAALTETRDELHRSNEALSVFAGQVSHDLRTP